MVKIIKNKIFMILIIGIFLISFASAVGDIGIVKQGDCIDLYNYCPTCSYINLTAIQNPNGTLETMNLEMEKNGNNYIYNYCNTSQLGEYSYTTCGDKGGTETCEDITFEVTPNGKQFTQQNSIVYLGFILILLFTFFLTMYGAGKIRWKHKKSDEGKILTINNFRYVKILLYSLAYFELMFLFGLSYKLCREADIDGFMQFFNFVYQIFQALIYPLMIFLIIIIFVTWINNKKLSKRLKLGLGK